MTPDPKLRCSDADREAIVADLRDHFAAGRLTLEEFDERSDTAYAARTFGDLDGLTADLPVIPATPRPPTEAEVERAKPPGRIESVLSGPLAPWLAVGVICTLIWVISGGVGHYFWPIWVIGPWGIMMLLGLRHGGGGRRDDVHRELRQEQHDLAVEAERMKLEEKRAQLKKRNERLERHDH